jgi:hypothetical protein
MVVVTACATPQVATGEWLAIAAARADAGQAVSLARELRREWPRATVVSSGDCAGFRPGLFLVVVRTSTTADAERTVAGLKGRFADAYRRECTPVAGSAIAAGLPTVDDSIFDVPSDAVNWDSRDMVSSVHTRDGRSIWIRRWYEKAPEDPLEGRRVSVLLREGAGDVRELLARCSGAEAVLAPTQAAVTCETLVAGSDLFHTVHVFDLATGKKTKTLDRCRNPHFEPNGDMVCEVEPDRPR